MLEISPIKMRKPVIRFMVEKYDPKTNKFYVQENHDGISAQGVDVECILGLKDVGLNIDAILYEEGDDMEYNIPGHFLSKKSGNIRIDELIADVIESKVADHDFLRKTVLVLLGTVLAPQYKITIPKPYYAIVQDVHRIKKLNFNEFTRSFLMGSLKKIETGYEMRQWPKGNLALLQVLF
jgi:hypothetical protein